MSDWRIIPAENMVAAFQVLLSSWLEQQYHKHGMAGFCGLSPCKSKMLMHLDRHCCSFLDSHSAIVYSMPQRSATILCWDYNQSQWSWGGFGPLMTYDVRENLGCWRLPEPCAEPGRQAVARCEISGGC